MSGHIYVPEFFDAIAPGSLRSAHAVLPILEEAVAPRSVLDVGCGIGTWLMPWRHLGIEDVCGVDGEYVDRERLQIPAERFVAADLEQPVDLGRRFDLVMSLEVAEHLAPHAAPVFVETLTRHADVVLFSAALPQQGGENHLNEQWPEYWAALFAAHGYLVADPVRPRVWNDPAVEWWYAQNALVLVRADRLADFPALRDTLVAPGQPLAMVHPRLWSVYRPCPRHEGLPAPAEALVVVADAAEIASDPELLSAWAAGAPSAATLMVLAPDGDPAAVEGALLDAFDRAGIDPDDGPEVVALVVPADDVAAVASEQARAAYGRATLAAPLDRLPRFAPEQLEDLRLLAAAGA
jgi:SAM-dependent methyltransferase